MSSNLYFGGFKKQKKVSARVLERAQKNKITQSRTPLERALIDLYKELVDYGAEKKAAKDLIAEISNMDIIVYMNDKLLANVILYLNREGIESLTDLSTRNFNSRKIEPILDSIFERVDDPEIENNRIADFCRYTFTVLEFKKRQLENPDFESNTEVQNFIQNIPETSGKRFTERIEPRY